MAAHQKRNAKTALMVSMSFAFIVFGGAGAELEINLLSVGISLYPFSPHFQDLLSARLGSDMVVWALPVDITGLDENNMHKFLT